MLCVTGAALRTQALSSFNYVIWGQTLIGLGSCLICNSQSLISVIWFKAQNRILATAINTSAYIVGLTISFSSTSFIIGGTAESAADIIYLLKVTFFASFLIAVPIVVLFKNKPQHAPSAVSEAPRVSMLTALRQLSGNRDFLYLLIAFSLNLGAYIAFLNIVEKLIQPFGYTDAQVGYIASFVNLACIIGKISVGLIANKILSFKRTL